LTTATDALPAASTKPPRRPSLRTRFGVAFLAGLIAVMAMGTGAIYAFDQAYQGRVLPGVHSGGVDLSGLATPAARQALADAYAGLSSGRVLVAGPQGDLTIGYAEIGRSPDLDAMLGSALAAGRTEGLVATAQAALRGVAVEPVVRWDAAKLATAVDAIARIVDRPASEAAVVNDEDGILRVVPSENGLALDRAALTSAVEAALAPATAPAEVRVELPVVAVLPVVDTADAIRARVAAERMSSDVLLQLGDESWTIKGTEIAALIRIVPTVDGSLAPVLDVAGLDPLLDKVAKAVRQQPRNASFMIDSGDIVGVKASRNGRTLDREGTRERIVDELMARRSLTPTPVLAPVVSVQAPGLTTEEAEKAAPLMKQISKWTTYFPISEKNGFGANIWIPSSIIDGYVVAPGETFDFWNAIGPVTREKGYKSGGAIINGRTEPQGALAGGICSCSTTLFNAALRAGFKMGARRNHYYYIDRYPLGLDATVFISASGSRQTMSWTNDTAHPVLIRGINTRKGNAGYVTFALYSVPNNRKVSFSKPVVKNVRRATDTVEYTSKLKAGTRQRIEYPVDGMEVWVTRTVTENGVVIHRNTYYSPYARITGVTLVGTGGSATSTPKPAPTPAPSP
jgi:vancomycin resistance protein YoaR